MASGPDWKAIEAGLRAADQAAARRQRSACRAVVERWNELLRLRRGAGPSPSLRTAIVAGFPFLDVLCPGCRQVKQIDLRGLDRHPETRLEMLIPALSCRDCRPQAPSARLIGLAEHRWESGNRPAYRPKRGL